MRRIAIAFLSLAFCYAPAASADTFGSGANTFDIDFVSIGNPGNLADTTGDPNPAGSVANTFRMGKFEISEDMIDKANSEGGLGITLADMTSFGGNGPGQPATGISWFEAAKFINWLNTDIGSTPAYKFDGGGNFQLWQVGDAGYDPNNLYRNSQAAYFLPSVDEWYKAAYYHPLGVYYDYPTGSNTAPIPVASGTVARTAVYGQSFNSGPADTTLAGGLSPYGTMGQGGNVWEWVETEFDLDNNSPLWVRGVRSGIWYRGSNFLVSSYWFDDYPALEASTVGFRIASIASIANIDALDLSPAAIYEVLDNTFDDLGNQVVDVTTASAASVGEVDKTDLNKISRLIAKFDLPDAPPGPLEKATLSFIPVRIMGTPAGPMSVKHSQTDNDMDQLASDFEDLSYVDASQDLIQPGDVIDQYYEVDVTSQVLADYAADGPDPISAFRLQIDRAVFVEDDVTHQYRLSMPNGTFRPQLLLTFVPEPSTALLLIIATAVTATWLTGRPCKMSMGH